MEIPKDELELNCVNLDEMEIAEYATYHYALPPPRNAPSRKAFDSMCKRFLHGF